ncbi:MAG: hypothetical protein Q9218_007656 [Villophora microphyllina]
MHSILSTLGLALRSVAVASICSLAATRLWSTLRLRKSKSPAPRVVKSAFASSSSATERKKKKSVQIVTDNNTRHTYTPVVAKFVAFHWRQSWIYVDCEPDPAGYDTLHCRKTLWVRDVPAMDERVDDDGDIGMDEF